VGLEKKVIGSRAARDLDLGLGSAGIEGLSLVGRWVDGNFNLSITGLE